MFFNVFMEVSKEDTFNGRIIKMFQTLENSKKRKIFDALNKEQRKMFYEIYDIFKVCQKN